MPITQKKIRFLTSIKNDENFIHFLNAAKNIQDRQGLLKLEDIKKIANSYGISDSVAMSILSFYEMLKFEKSSPKNICKVPGCFTESTNLDNCQFKNCLGLCDYDNPAIYNGKQVSFKNNKASEIGKTKILNQNSDNLCLLNCSDINYYFERLENLLKIQPDKLIEKITISNLTGKGGAKFPTGKKLVITRQNKGEKFVICNADESEPFVFKDRGIIDNNPYAVVSGMILAAHMVDAKEIYIYVRGEYIRQKEVLKETIKSFQNKFTQFNFKIVSGVGAYVCGEETALIESIEGKRGHPRKKPPFPGESGLFNKPTLIFNVETMGWIFEIIDKDLNLADKSIFCIAGEVKTKGIFETNGSNSINEIVTNFCSGFINENDDYFALIGGASGFFIDKREFDLPIKNLFEKGACIGSIYILSGFNRLKDIMVYIAGFLAEESCGQCNPCFLGYSKLKNLIITDRYDEAFSLSSYISKSTLCGLGKSSVQPLLSYINIIKGAEID